MTSRYLTSRLSSVAAVLLLLGTIPLAAEPKLNLSSPPQIELQPEDDLLGTSEFESDLDFGVPLVGEPAVLDPFPGGNVETDFETDSEFSDNTAAGNSAPGSTTTSEVGTGPDFRALPDEELLGLKQFGAQLLLSLQTNDPEKLKALPPSILSKIDAIIADPASLSAEETAQLMQHFVTLGATGYVAPARPVLPSFPNPPMELQEPLVVQPVLPALPYIDPGYPIETPPNGATGNAATVGGYRNEHGFAYGGTLFDHPYARISERGTSDFQFGAFFAVPFDAENSLRVLRLEVDRAALLAPRAFYDSDALGSLTTELIDEKSGNRSSDLTDLISIAPGSYDFVVRIRNVGTSGKVTLRLDLRDQIDKTEPNNTQEQAVAIELPFRQTLFLEDKEDVDWLTFSVEEEGVLSAAATHAEVEILATDGTLLPISSTGSGTRYAIVPAGTYFAKVRGSGETRTGKVTLRFYPPSGIAAEINRIIGVGLENDESVAEQMRAVSFATGVPLIETTDAAEITTALQEASKVEKGLSWWWAFLLAAGLAALGAIGFILLAYWRKRSD